MARHGRYDSNDWGTASDPFYPAILDGGYPEFQTNHGFPSNPLGIAEFFGSGVTESAMEHRFRPARAHAKLMIELVKAGEDPGEYDFVDMNSTGKNSA